MKTIIITISSIVLSCSSINAQRGTGRDTTRLDSSWISSSHLPYLQAVLEAPVLIGTSTPQNISPTGQKICFDKIIKLKTATSRGIGELCLFINTKIGLIGYTPVKPGEVGICDIKPEESKFNLNVIGLKGNTYNYFNTKKNGVIEHWMSTGNSQTHQYQFSYASTSMLHRKTERRDYCDGKIKAWSYKYDGRTEEWFLFGKIFPDVLQMQPLKYLGNFGVGFQNTDKGLFIIMQMISTGIDSKIIDIRDIDICFDPAPFKIFEDESIIKQQQSISREIEKLEKDAAKAVGQECSELEINRINFQKSTLDRREEDLQVSRQQNIYQSDIRTQKARADATINYNDVIQISILETKYKICRTQHHLQETQSKGGSGEGYQRKIACLQQQLATQLRVQTEMEALDRQYPAEPGRAFAQKARIIMQALSGCD
ncbi:MAG: hypothetical protein ACKVOW_12205 [Chitinophagaceae bacterium]